MALKRKFRLEWGEKWLNEKTTQVKTKSREWEIVDAEIGTYEPVSRILFFEGGKDDDEAVRATTLYVRKALQMGGVVGSVEPDDGAL